MSRRFGEYCTQRLTDSRERFGIDLTDRRLDCVLRDRKQFHPDDRTLTQMRAGAILNGDIEWPCRPRRQGDHDSDDVPCFCINGRIRNHQNRANAIPIEVRKTKRRDDNVTAVDSHAMRLRLRDSATHRTIGYQSGSHRIWAAQRQCAGHVPHRHRLPKSGDHRR